MKTYKKFNKKICLLCYILFIPVSLFAQEKVYKLGGRINGVQEGEKVFARLLNSESSQMEKRDSAYVKNGEFHIKGVVPNDGPREYLFSFEKSKKGFNLIIANGDDAFVRCQTDVKTFNHPFIDFILDIENAPYARSKRALHPAYLLYSRIVSDLRHHADKIVDSVGFEGQLLKGVFESIDQVNRSFGKEIFSLKTISQVDESDRLGYLYWIAYVIEDSKHASFLTSSYNSLSDKQKNSYYGQILKMYAPICVGQPFPEFNLPSADGKQLSSKEVTSKSKLTLVHFWAETSYQRKKYEDELRVLYKNYHDKGLNIIGYSTDKNEEEWKENLTNEQFPWYNVAEIKSKRNAIADKVYHEYSTADSPDIHNTTNVLIDAQGRIVAWDVTGVELHYYLWKYLEDNNK